MVRQKGLEPLAYCLEGSCSIRLSYWREFLDGAGDENRTRIPSLEGWCPDHCATPASAQLKGLALPGNRQLGHNTMNLSNCQAVFAGFPFFFEFFSQRPKFKKAARSFFPAGDASRRSGCHCTAHTGSRRWQSASTTPSAVHCTARSPLPSRSAA